MKMIIDGRKYDTETALLVFNEIEYEDQFNQLKLELYRNRFGKFFIVRRDQPDDNLTPVSDKEAIRLMERYSNSKIEDFFQVDEAGAISQSTEKLTEVQIAVRLPKFLLDKAKDEAKSKRLSFNTWAIRSFENTLASGE